jgi:uncharacterized protein YlxW (UPF0749 family)
MNDVEPPESATVDDAAEPAASPSTARPRLRLTWGLVVPVVMAAAGVMFAMSFQTAQGRDLRADRDLPQLIMEGDSRVAEKAGVLDGLQKEVEALSKSNAPTDDHLSSLTRTADELAASAATTKVRGAALEVTLDDAKRTADSLPDGFTADDIVVHQQDVQAVVNALWTSGAEAMMIQDQRVISTSAVRCVGNTLVLQGRVYSPPYVVTAIGSPAKLQAALSTEPGVRIYLDYVHQVGLRWSQEDLRQVRVPAFDGSVQLSYVKASP